MAQQEPRRADAQFVKRSRSPWLMMALIFGGLILLALIALRPNRTLQSSPAGDSPVAVQPTPDQVQFENIELAPSPTPAGTAGNNVTIQADLRNYADVPVTGVQVEAVFKDSNGEAIFRQTQPVLAVDKQGQSATEVPLRNSPVPRRGIHAVRMTFSAVPVNWDKRRPDLNVKDVQAQSLAKSTEKQ